MSLASVTISFVVPAILELAASRSFDVEDANGALALADVLRLYRESNARSNNELCEYMRISFLPAQNLNSLLVEHLLHNLFVEVDSKKQRGFFKVCKIFCEIFCFSFLTHLNRTSSVARDIYHYKIRID